MFWKTFANVLVTLIILGGGAWIIYKIYKLIKGYKAAPAPTGTAGGGPTTEPEHPNPNKEKKDPPKPV